MIKFEKDDSKNNDVIIKFNITKYAYTMLFYVCVILFLALVSIFGFSMTPRMDILVLVLFATVSIGYIITTIGPAKVFRRLINTVKKLGNSENKTAD
jgi:hypothetical protein